MSDVELKLAELAKLEFDWDKRVKYWRNGPDRKPAGESVVLNSLHYVFNLFT